MRNRKMNKLFLVLALGLCLAVTTGCGSEADVYVQTEESDSLAEETADTEEEEVTEQDSDTEEEKEEPSTEEEVSVEDTANAASAEDDPIYQKFINDELELDGEKFSEIFSFVEEDFGMEPVTFYYDVDEDGKDELLVSTVFYGYNIYDVKDGELLLLDCGDGTAAACGVYKADDHVYVSHSDFSHAGRQMLSLTRYDGDGNVVETIEINAEYWDNEDDVYDETSDFTYNGQKITMQEYEDYMNSYVFIDPDSEGARPAP